MKIDLSNKIALITGGSGGIGKSICEQFIAANCKIIFTSSDEDKLKDLKKLFGDKHLYYYLDLSNTHNLQNNIKKIADENKNIDILINNAGITRDNLFLRMKSEQWNEVIDVNLNSNYYIIKSIIPSMIKSRRGKIIGITSVVASTGNSGQSNYSASKAGLVAMYKSLALEVAQRNININLIAPGFISTPMTSKLNEAQQNNIMNQIPMKKFGSPQDIANLALFLSSEHSSYITGQTFHVNGGMLML